MKEEVKSKKLCKYGCGKMVWWDDTIAAKIKWRELDTGVAHNYPRCADLLKEQNKDLGVLKNK